MLLFCFYVCRQKAVSIRAKLVCVFSRFAPMRANNFEFFFHLSWNWRKREHGSIDWYFFFLIYHLYPAGFLPSVLQIPVDPAARVPSPGPTARAAPLGVPRRLRGCPRWEARSPLPQSDGFPWKRIPDRWFGKRWNLNSETGFCPEKKEEKGEVCIIEYSAQ